MKKILGFSVVAIPEKRGYSCLCPELEVASQGDTIEEGLKNLKEAMELHISCLTPRELNEIKSRKGTRVTATIEVPVPA